MGFNWKLAIKRFIKAEMALQGVTRLQMAERLAKLGVAETENSLNNKLSRGTFSAAFFLQCMTALDKDAPRVLSVVPMSVRMGEGLSMPTPKQLRPRRRPKPPTTDDQTQANSYAERTACVEACEAVNS